MGKYERVEHLPLLVSVHRRLSQDSLSRAFALDFVRRTVQRPSRHTPESAAMEGMSETDRIVIVASGFGLWLDGQHVASARWGDVARMRAVRAVSPAVSIVVEITLADGRTIELREHVAGWRTFLNAAASRLSGIPPIDHWRPELSSPDSDVGEALLFDRSTRRR
jgi:hypothetical protein